MCVVSGVRIVMVTWMTLIMLDVNSTRQMTSAYACIYVSNVLMVFWATGNVEHVINNDIQKKVDYSIPVYFPRCIKINGKETVLICGVAVYLFHVVCLLVRSIDVGSCGSHKYVRKRLRVYKGRRMLYPTNEFRVGWNGIFGIVAPTRVKPVDIWKRKYSYLGWFGG